MGIACEVIVKSPRTVQNHLLMDRYVEIAKVNYIEPKHEVILGSLFLTNRLLQPNQQTKREIHRTLLIQRKNRSQGIRSLFRRAEERRNEEQTTGVNNKSDKQYHEVININ